MPLDNLNPTVFHNATGGGRKRLERIKRLYLPKTREDDEEEPTFTSIKELSEYLDQFHTESSFHEYDDEKHGQDKPVDCIDAEEIYSKFISEEFFLAYMTN